MTPKLDLTTRGQGFQILPIGTVRSPLTHRASAPKQGDEGAPEAWIDFEPPMMPALDGVAPGDHILVLTWFHLARRDVLRVHPRGDESRDEQGVFSTRSPHRPNPIGLHRVEVISVAGGRIGVRGLEAVDGTPVVDVKPVLSRRAAER
jgi:tRNA-Thr(GGU) m(6)t(6)A37 methyltransferase TsaA